MNEKTRLYRFELFCGRGGTLRGIFAATEEDVRPAFGKRCYFGEVLGKHSEIQCVLEPEHVRFLTDDQAFISKAMEYGLVPQGFNPLLAITCRGCGEPMEAPYEFCSCEGGYG